MTWPLDEALPLEEHVLVALEELAQASGLSAQEIIELVEYGVFEPVGAGVGSAGEAQAWRFAARCIVTGRTASRLRKDFDLPTSGLALVLSLIERIETLERQVRVLEAQLLRG
ncbi:MAG TPA: chaperone modulator CbpM [Burkholderiales bacterium]|nr:chaperone modulator CbpM [Burkholderiales bacterium]